MTDEWPDWLEPKSIEDARARAGTIPAAALENARDAALDSRAAADAIISAAEAKAATILGIAGVLAALVAGALAFLSARSPDLVTNWKTRTELVLVTSSLIGVALCLWFSHQATRIGPYVTQHPNPDQALRFDAGAIDGLREWIATATFYAANNYIVAQRKSSVLRFAQTALLWAVILAAASAVLVGTELW